MVDSMARQQECRGDYETTRWSHSPIIDCVPNYVQPYLPWPSSTMYTRVVVVVVVISW